MVACAALFLLLDVADGSSYRPGVNCSIMQPCRCGNEAGNKVFCGKHKKGPHIYLIAKNGDVVRTCNTLSQLAPLLGVQEVTLKDELGDLAGKLKEPEVPADAAAPAANAGSGVRAAANGPKPLQAAGRKRSGAELRLSGPSSSKAASRPNAAAAAGGSSQQPSGATAITGAVLRLQLSADQAQQALQLEQEETGMQQSLLRTAQLQAGYLEVPLNVTPGCCNQHPCMGVNLRLGVGSVQELAASR